MKAITESAMRELDNCVMINAVLWMLQRIMQRIAVERVLIVILIYWTPEFTQHMFTAYARRQQTSKLIRHSRARVANSLLITVKINHYTRATFKLRGSIVSRLAKSG